ncbi:hypothetical protein HDV00_009401 [Rhizophlyctis rosea]|nr:hypothetical protein HDV00_009401 [Rhizophlyctis rosea]
MEVTPSYLDGTPQTINPPSTFQPTLTFGNNHRPFYLDTTCCTSTAASPPVLKVAFTWYEFAGPEHETPLKTAAMNIYIPTPKLFEPCPPDKYWERGTTAGVRCYSRLGVAVEYERKDYEDPADFTMDYELTVRQVRIDADVWIRGGK